jgi:hypothetical protein
MTWSILGVAQATHRDSKRSYSRLTTE